MRSRDDASFEEAFGAHYPGVLAFVARRVGADVAEDVAAEVFLRAWNTWDTAPADARPWLFGIARHLVVDQFREAERRRRLELRAATGTAHTCDDHTLTDTTVDLRRAWERLTDTDREVLALIAWDGLTARQAATVLGCTRAAFSVRLTRARRRLHQHLGGTGNIPAGEHPPDETQSTTGHSTRENRRTARSLS